MNKQNKTYKTPRKETTQKAAGKSASVGKSNEPLSRQLMQMLVQPAGQLGGKFKLAIAAIIFILGFLLYANTLTHDYALDDDLVYKLNNSVQKGISGIPEIFHTTNMYGFNQQNFGAYRPFTQILFALEFQAFGLKPHMQHLVSVLMFALMSMLLFLLLKRMFRDKPFWIPLAITLIFVAHPIHTEVVANIKSRDELISFLFGFVLTFLALFRYIDKKKVVWLVLSVLSFFTGLMSKEHIVTLVPMIPLTLYFFSDKKLKQILLTSLWYLIPLVLFLVLRATLIDSSEGKIVFLDNFVIHIKSFTDKAGTIMYILLYYLRLMVFPFPQSCDYTWAQTPQVSLFSIWPIISVLIYLAMIAGSVILFLKKNILSWCLLFFLFTISMYSHIYAGLAATMAERLLFTPSLPLIIALIFLLYKAADRIGKQAARLNMIIWPVIVVFMIFSAKTIARNTVWKNSDTLFLNDVENAPNSARMNKSAGDVYINMGKEDKDTVRKNQCLNLAVTYLKKAYTIYPEYPDNLLDLGTAFYYLADYDSAWRYWQLFNKVQPESARNQANLSYMASAYYVKGQELARQRRDDEAFGALRRSLEFDSLYHPSLFSLGLAYANILDYVHSKYYMEKALRIDSLNVDYWYNLGGMLYTAKDFAGAKQAWKKALQLNPDHAEAKKGLQAVGGPD
jgi:protein O-mannosyl-transferase